MYLRHLCQIALVHQHLFLVAYDIERLSGLSVPERDARGKLVALIEVPSEVAILEAIRGVEAVAGVLSASLVYHQVDTAET